MTGNHLTRSDRMLSAVFKHCLHQQPVLKPFGDVGVTLQSLVSEEINEPCEDLNIVRRKDVTIPTQKRILGGVTIHQGIGEVARDCADDLLHVPKIPRMKNHVEEHQGLNTAFFQESRGVDPFQELLLLTVKWIYTLPLGPQFEKRHLENFVQSSWIEIVGGKCDKVRRRFF